jgi:hypothetical protein
MSESEPAEISQSEQRRVNQTPGFGSVLNVDAGLVEGRSKLVLFVGMSGLVVGSFIEVSEVFLGSVSLVGIAFILNTIGKLHHYRALPIPTRSQLALAATWVLLAITALSLIGTYTIARFLGGQGSFFWPLAIAGVGFGLLHMAAQSRFLSAEYQETD